MTRTHKYICAALSLCFTLLCIGTYSIFGNLSVVKALIPVCFQVIFFLLLGEKSLVSCSLSPTCDRTGQISCFKRCGRGSSGRRFRLDMGLPGAFGSNLSALPQTLARCPQDHGELGRSVFHNGDSRHRCICHSNHLNILLIWKKKRDCILSASAPCRTIIYGAARPSVPLPSVTGTR